MNVECRMNECYTALWLDCYIVLLLYIATIKS